jgi:hypothetical protein
MHNDQLFKRRKQVANDAGGAEFLIDSLVHPQGVRNVNGAIAYQELTGKNADLIEVLNLDEKGKTTREPVDDPLLISVRHKIRDAGEALRTNKLLRLPRWDEHACGSCDLVGLCGSRQRGSSAQGGFVLFAIGRLGVTTPGCLAVTLRAAY